MTMERPDVMTLTRAGGELAYDVRGEGPVVICTPDAGDLRSSFTAFASRLASVGFRVATTDLRGHGGSSAQWPAHGEQEVADDLLTLAGQLSADPVILAGCGASAAAAIMVAAVRPDRVAALVLFNPQVLAPPAGRHWSMLQRVSGSPRLARMLWSRHWRQLHVRPPADLAARRRELEQNLAQPGRFDAVRAMQAAAARPASGGDNHPGNARAANLLPHVTCPVLVMMGEADQDTAEPGLQAQNLVENLGGPARVLLVPGVGHFPHAEVPEVAASQTNAFLRAHAVLPHA